MLLFKLAKLNKDTSRYVQGVPKKELIKTFILTCHRFNSQFLNLFGFSISVRVFGVSFNPGPI